MSNKLVSMGFKRNYITRAFKVYEKNYGHSYNIEIITEIIVRLQNKDKAQKALNLAQNQSKNEDIPPAIHNHNKMLIDEKNDAELVESNGNDNNNNNINNIEIQSMGIAIGTHTDFWNCNNEFAIAPKLIINKHSIDLCMKSIHGEIEKMSIKNEEIRNIYMPENPQLFTLDELNINPALVDQCKDNGQDINSCIQMIFIQTKDQLGGRYQWSKDCYNPNCMTAAKERISIFMCAEEYIELKRNWWLNKMLFMDLYKKIQHIKDDEKEIWLGNIQFGRSIKRFWNKYDAERTRERIDTILNPYENDNNNNKNEKDSDRDNKEQEIILKVNKQTGSANGNKKMSKTRKRKENNNNNNKKEKDNEDSDNKDTENEIYIDRVQIIGDPNHKYCDGDVVWAKFKDFPWWPAQIEINGNKTKVNTINVRWFGDYDGVTNECELVNVIPWDPDDADRICVEVEEEDLESFLNSMDIANTTHLQICEERALEPTQSSLDYEEINVLRQNQSTNTNNKNKAREKTNIIEEQRGNDNNNIKPPALKKRGENMKYPRIANLKGEIWKRKYSKEEKKYFWCSGIKSSWNPWTDHHNLSPPWRNGRQQWTKFKDDTNKPYYFNYDNGTSTYKKPKGYMSAEEIDHDSMDDDTHDDDDIKVAEQKGNTNNNNKQEMDENKNNSKKRKRIELGSIENELPLKRMKLCDKNKKMKKKKKKSKENKYKKENIALKQENKTLKERMDIMQKRLDMLECKSERINAMNLNELNEMKMEIESKMKLIIDAEKRLIDNKYKCVACKDNPKNISFDGCSHIAICDKCEILLQSKCCPICQIPYRNVRKINF